MAKRVRFENNRSATAEELLELFHSLLQLRAQTDPNDGESSAVDKHKRAIEAVDRAMLLVRGLAGWALDQIAGSALERDEAPNLHEHEFVGRRIANRDFVADPKRYRLALAALVRSLDNLLPIATAKTLSEAVRALNMGELRPILRRLSQESMGKHTPFGEGERRPFFDMSILRRSGRSKGKGSRSRN